jgi:hypothetical protein
MKHSFYYLLVLVTAGLASCYQTKDVPCTNGMLAFTAAGFTDSDYVNAIIVQYQPDSLFDNPVDTGKITHYFFQHGSMTSDSANIYIQFKKGGGTPNGVSGSYDYVIMFPAAGINDTISNVQFLGRTSETFKYSGVSHDRPLACTNPVTSYTYNGAGFASSEPNVCLVFLTK